jgi:outer membrane murein-binding lipoprotein Lpp
MTISHGGRISAVFLTLALLSGCASNEPVAEASIASTNLQQSMDRVEVEIVDELRLLAKLRDEERNNRLTEEQKRQRILQANDERVPPAFKQRASMSIPPKDAHEVCTLIAESVEYESTVEGAIPRRPIWVRINIRDEPIYSAVMELGRQTGSAFTMEIYPLSKLVRCVYNREVNS